MKALNLYAGIGGNRKLWPAELNGEKVEVTAVEINPEIARIYQDFFPQDKVIVADAHQYLLEHYKEYDFIWSSPPCPTHSRIRKYTNGGRFKDVYPDMSLWQEIIFLQHHCSCKWVVENVIPYYELIPAQQAGRHCFWANFNIQMKEYPPEIRNTKHRHKGSAIDEYFPDVPRQLNRNCVNPKLGLHIFNCAFKERQEVLTC